MNKAKVEPIPVNSCIQISLGDLSFTVAGSEDFVQEMIRKALSTLHPFYDNVQMLSIWGDKYATKP